MQCPRCGNFYNVTGTSGLCDECLRRTRSRHPEQHIGATADPVDRPAREQEIEDFDWAKERVTNMCAAALVDASRLGTKILKGFGYPDEIFCRAQDYRALSKVLDRLASLETQLRSVAQERDALKADHAALERGIAYRSVVEEAGRQSTRAEQAEAALARLRGALQTHMQWTDEHGVTRCDGCNYPWKGPHADDCWVKAALADAPAAPLQGETDR